MKHYVALCTVFGMFQLMVTMISRGGSTTPDFFPAEIRTAWEMAGFKVGRMIDNNGMLRFIQVDKPQEKRTIPFMSLDSWRAGAAAHLPQPPTAFGMDLTNSAGKVEISDLVLKEFSGLKNLEILHLDATSVTSDGLACLREINRLSVLTLIGGQFNNVGSKHLAGLKKLQKLTFIETTIPVADFGMFTNISSLTVIGMTLTDEGIRRMNGLGQLEALHLGSVGLRDADLGNLVGLKKIKRLDVSQNRVTDAGLKHICKMASLQELCLSNTDISDEGLGRLVDLSNLRRLDLQKTQVTDQGMMELSKLKNLQELDIYGCTITDMAVIKLRKILPNVKINQTKRAGSIA